MSLANIRRLLQEDTILSLPAITAMAAARKRVVSIVAFDFCPLEKGAIQIVQMCILQINTQGNIMWSYDTVAPTVSLPDHWLKQHGFDERLLNKSPTWAKGWSQALWHMGQHNTIVVPQVEDLHLLNSNATPIEFKYPLTLRGTFHEKHPGKSASMQDMTAYYQVYLDPDKNLKARIVTYAKLLEKMLAEQPLVPNDAVDQTLNNQHSIPLEDARKWVLRAEAGAQTPLDFFEKIVQMFPFQLVCTDSKIQGYSIQANDQWIKGSQLDSHLGWSQIAQDHHWKITPADITNITAISTQPYSKTLQR